MNSRWCGDNDALARERGAAGLARSQRVTSSGDRREREGYREILGICEGAKEDKAGWRAFLKHLKERGLRGVRLIISHACLGLAESAAEFFPEAAWHRCIVGSLKKWPVCPFYASRRVKRCEE